MTTATTDDQHLAQLKSLLQEKKKERDFEKMTAALMAELLDLPIFVASSGFQHGADAGTGGQATRRLRLECKKYSDTTDLDVRELIGEIEQASARDKALEGWFLIATRVVKEQMVQTLEQFGDRLGLPVVVIDWTGPGIPPLAALCAAYPDIVEKLFSPAAAAEARALSCPSKEALERLKKTCQAWCLGFQSLRNAAHGEIRNIWTNPKISQASLNQDVAGGAITKRISRQNVSTALAQWWTKAAADAPAVMVGPEGVGKTWATLDWIVSSLVHLPIAVLLPSSAMVNAGKPTETSILQALGARLQEITKVRDAAHWSARIRKLLERPAAEGPALTLVFDGMNQEASLVWNQILKILQAPPFAGQIRVIASTRTLHYGDKLASLKGLVVPPVRVDVDRYSDEPGGELDQMLAFEGLTRADLSPDLIDLARTPRLFKLVVHLRSRLANIKEVTVHRLLWEYGRDSFGERAGKSFSEDDWQDWLREIAKQVRDGITEFSNKTLAETATRPDLTASEVSARLSDILDSQFSKRSPSGQIVIRPDVVAHALGLALTHFLTDFSDKPFNTLEAKLDEWLDPIRGMDQRAEILRAAVSIEIERKLPSSRRIMGPLITAWLQTQNLPDEHRDELAALASDVVPGLLDAIQYSPVSSQASARHWAMKAVTGLPKKAGPPFDDIVERCTAWISIVNMEMYPHYMKEESIRKSREERYRERTGSIVPGPVTVLGVPLSLEEIGDDVLTETVPILLDGFPLTPALKCFEAASVVLAIRGHFDAWKGLKWLCELNEIDPTEMADALRKLSDDFISRKTEPGIITTLGHRAAGVTLCLSGIESDEVKCGQLTPIADGTFDYQRDYLDNPGKSFYALERRHADKVMADSGISVIGRIQKCRLMLYDPAFKVPDSFVAELRAFAEAFPIEKMHRHNSYTHEDHLFESLEPALARWAPDVLAGLIERYYVSVASAPPDARYWAAGHVGDFFLLGDKAAADACGALRASAKETDPSSENFVSNYLMALELKGLDTKEQFRRVIAADVTWIAMDLGHVLGRPTPEEIDDLIDDYRSGTDREKHDLILLLSFHPRDLTNRGWIWFKEQLETADRDLRGILYRFLALADESRFGRQLLDQHWTWDPKETVWTNHFGSLALIAGGRSVPFDQLAPRIVPWLVLEAARVRGSDEFEVRLAADIVGAVIENGKMAEPDPGSDLVFRRDEKTPAPFHIEIELRPNAVVTANPAQKLRDMLDRDARAEEWNRAIKAAHERIDEARANGASFYMTDLDADDFADVVKFAGARVDRWLAGMEEQTIEFKRRVRLSESAFLGLCEALLNFDPKRGVALWNALRATMTTRYVGRAEVPDLIHMLFRAQDSADVAEARTLLLNDAATDKELFELSLSARMNEKDAFIDNLRSADSKSPFIWRQRRGQMLAGFNGIPPYFDDAIWPSDVVSTTSAEISRDAGYFRFQESAAYHWFCVFLDSANPAEAYSAWVLFKGSADRRVQIWMQAEVDKRQSASPNLRAKLGHLSINQNNIKRAMTKREEKSEKKYLDQEIYLGIGPWRNIQRSG
jgi:hypothetical protein